MAAERRPLLAMLAVQQRIGRQISVDLERAAEDAERQVTRLLGGGRSGRSAPIRAAQVRRVLGQISVGQRELWRDGILPATVTGRREAMIAAHDVADELTAFLYRRLRGPDADTLREALQATARAGLEAAAARVPRELSTAVYRNADIASGQIERHLRSGIARGLTARELALEVRWYISPRTRGGVSYAAMRLARTEISAAFRERSIADATNRPGVTGLRWNLSESHPRPDKCDEYAGKVYPPDKYPDLVHPHDMCYPTPVTQSPTQVVRAIERGDFDDELRRRIEARRAARRAS